MACNLTTTEETSDNVGQEEESSLHQGSADELCVTFELPVCLKPIKGQKCLLDSFPFLPERSSESTWILSLNSTEREDFYIPYDSTAPNPVCDGKVKTNVYVKPSNVICRSLSEFQALPKDPRVRPSRPSPDAFEKLPSSFNHAVQHPQVDGEYNILILFHLGNRCYPFCAECNTPSPSYHITIDKKAYFFSEIYKICDTQFPKEGLTINLFFLEEAYSLHIPEFDSQKEIDLRISTTTFQLVLRSRETPSFTAANIPRESYYFSTRKHDFRMKGDSLSDIYLPENCDAPVFHKKFWSNRDEVELNSKGLKGLKRPSYTLSYPARINIGSKGTLSVHYSSARVFLGNGIFRIFIKENNDLIALQKFLKVSLKLSQRVE